MVNRSGYIREAIGIELCDTNSAYNVDLEYSTLLLPFKVASYYLC